MDNSQQIAALRSAITAIDARVAEVQAKLRSAATQEEIDSLTAALADLQAERSRLQAELDNLESAVPEVPALGQENGANE